MKPLTKIAGYNILVILLYSILVRLAHPGDSLSITIVSGTTICLHVLACLLVAAGSWSSNRERGRAWLLSAGIVLLVGFSACLGNASF